MQRSGGPFSRSVVVVVVVEIGWRNLANPSYLFTEPDRARQLYRGYPSTGTKLGQDWLDEGQQLPPG